MPTDMTVPVPRRSSRRVFLPIILLAIVAIAWSGFWWYATSRVSTEMDRFIAKQAELGRQISCDQRSVGGYPFRIEVHCASPKVEGNRAGKAFSANLGEINAVAQVYQPNKVLLEAKSPMVLVDKDGDGVTVTSNWTSAEASASIWTSGPQNADMVIKGLTTTVDRGGQTQTMFDTANVEAHIRLAEGANAAPGAYDLAADVDAKAVAPVDLFLGASSPLSATFRGTITRIDLQPMPMEDRLRDWAENGGTLTITQAQLNRGPSSVKASGMVGLETSGHPSGDLVVALSGVPELADTLKQSGRVPASLTSLLGVGLSMLGKPTNIDGKAAVEVPVKVANGKVNIGAFPAGKVPKLF
ncbi:DUF2125 domain-containing protein [Labrys okinawensis]|uniref:DUF2125 domain-containing protein n=1 Tax=Labrys okinawensis TaxID=346911 RepID=UPI0039BC7A68